MNLLSFLASLAKLNPPLLHDHRDKSISIAHQTPQRAIPRPDNLRLAQQPPSTWRQQTSPEQHRKETTARFRAGLESGRSDQMKSEDKVPVTTRFMICYHTTLPLTLLLKSGGVNSETQSSIRTATSLDISRVSSRCRPSAMLANSACKTYKQNV